MRGAADDEMAVIRPNFDDLDIFVLRLFLLLKKRCGRGAGLRLNDLANS